MTGFHTGRQYMLTTEDQPLIFALVTLRFSYEPKPQEHCSVGSVPQPCPRPAGRSPSPGPHQHPGPPWPLHVPLAPKSSGRHLLDSPGGGCIWGGRAPDSLCPVAVGLAAVSSSAKLSVFLQGLVSGKARTEAPVDGLYTPIFPHFVHHP